MSANIDRTSKPAGLMQDDEHGGKASNCAGLPDALRKLLLADPAVVLGLCLRPIFLNAAGRRALTRVLEHHARTNPAARAGLEMIERKGRVVH